MCFIVGSFSTSGAEQLAQEGCNLQAVCDIPCHNLIVVLQSEDISAMRQVAGKECQLIAHYLLTRRISVPCVVGFRTRINLESGVIQERRCSSEFGDPS